LLTAGGGNSVGVASRISATGDTSGEFHADAVPSHVS